MESNLIAQINNPAISSNLTNMSGVEFFGSFTKGIIGTAMVVAGIGFIFMLLWGGLRYITSQGDKVQAETSRKTITNAVIGIVIVFALYAILQIVGCFFGLDFLRINIGELNVSFGACSGSTGAASNGTPPHP